MSDDALAIQGRPADEPHTWRKACANTACVEVSMGNESVMVRHSGEPGGPVLAFSRDEWRSFVAGVKRGDFDSE